MSDMKIVIAGAAGRMGRMLIKSVIKTEGCVLAAAYEAPGNPQIGLDAGVVAGIEPVGIPLSDDMDGSIRKGDCVIDFTVPAATIKALNAVPDHPRAHVIGTTGFDADQDKEIQAAAGRFAIVKAGNMSLGVNLLAQLARQIAGMLDASFDIEILEMHHKHKVDAPSGTALMLGEAAAQGRGVHLDDVAAGVRDGHTGERQTGDIGFAVLRGGEVVGEHTVYFVSDNERIEISHKASDRSIFSDGAVGAALWTNGNPPGLYSMADVLGYSER